MATHGAVLTAEEFFAMPEDDQLHELLDGELMVRPTPVPLRRP